MRIAEVAASLVGGAALEAPISELIKLLTVVAKKVTDFKPLSQDLASTVERLVPILTEIDLMQQGLDPCEDELKVLVDKIERAKEMVSKCSRVRWYSIAKKCSYTRTIKAINQDFLRFCQTELQLIMYKTQLKYMRPMASVTTEIDQLSETGKEFAELFIVPEPGEDKVSWLDRPLKELKKMLLEDGVATAVVSAPSACGKTTLVTKLCHDADVKGKFKQIFFMTMSKGTNIRLTLQRLLEHTGCSTNESANNFNASLCYQQMLTQLAKSGSILLVLDDVCPEEESLIHNFLIQLPDYKIVVTSRFEIPSFGPTFHLEPLIDDVKNLFIEYAPQPNCPSCTKHDHLVQKILKRSNGLPLAVNPPSSICGGCNADVEHGSSVNVSGVLWHRKCLWCDACHGPIAIHQDEHHVSNSRGKFHKSCYQRYCYVCKEKVKRYYNEHPFWRERYCLAHETDGTARCCSCERLEAKGANYVMFRDGRLLCPECMKSAVMHTCEAQPLHSEIRKFFEHLNMKVEEEFPLLLVEEKALNWADEEDKIDNWYKVVTRGICLPEELVISMVSKGPRNGLNMQLIGISSKSEKVVREGEINALVILYGFPRLLLGYILAHEMMHAWLRINGYRNLSRVMNEGLCQMVAHMWLESQTAASSSHTPPPAATTYKKHDLSNFEKKLVEFCKFQIETDESPVYGVGFRTVNKMMVSNNYNLKDTIRDIVSASTTIPQAHSNI